MSIDKLMNKCLDHIFEGKRSSRSVSTRNRKIKQATSSMATSMARKKNDSAYKNMIKYKKLYHKYRDIIHKKYSARTRSRARR